MLLKRRSISAVQNSHFAAILCQSCAKILTICCSFCPKPLFNFEKGLTFPLYRCSTILTTKSRSLNLLWRHLLLRDQYKELASMNQLASSVLQLDQDAYPLRHCRALTAISRTMLHKYLEELQHSKIPLYCRSSTMPIRGGCKSFKMSQMAMKVFRL
jgi:hypothetical protein